jgi:acyl-CoA-binding protein
MANDDDIQALRRQFDRAVEAIRPIKTVSSDDQLKLYGLYKCITATETSTSDPESRPSIFSPVARAKWDAVQAVKDLDLETAMAQYCVIVEKYTSISHA